MIIWLKSIAVSLKGEGKISGVVNIQEMTIKKNNHMSKEVRHKIAFFVSLQL